jgi:hypothetical protein
MEHIQNYSAGTSRQDTTSRDEARQVVTSDDYISIKEALAIFVEQGRPVTERTLQRYCDKKQLTGQKILTGEGEKWFVLKSSVFNRIAELAEFDRLRGARQDTTSRDVSPVIAEQTSTLFTSDNMRQATEPGIVSPLVAQETSRATGHDTSQHDETSRDMSRPSGETVEHKSAITLPERA